MFNERMTILKGKRQCGMTTRLLCKAIMQTSASGEHIVYVTRPLMKEVVVERVKSFLGYGWNNHRDDDQLFICSKTPEDLDGVMTIIYDNCEIEDATLAKISDQVPEVIVAITEDDPT